MNRDPAINATTNSESLLDSLVPASQKESVVVEQVQRNPRRVKRYCRLLTCASVCLVVWLFIAAALPFILDILVTKLAADQAVLTPDNYKIWGQIPGESQTDFVREFAFFNFSNWEDVLWRGQKPQFSEIQGYKFLELQEDLDPKFSENGEQVSFNYWLHFKQKNGSRDPNELLTVINPGPLGFWYNIKTTKPSLLFIQGLGILFLQLEHIIRNVVAGLAINKQFLLDFNSAYAGVYGPADVSNQTATFLWNDPSLGMKELEHLVVWIDAARKGFTSVEAQNLGNYFGLTTPQLKVIMDTFIRYYDGLQTMVYDNHYCQDGRSCTTFDLAVRQLGFAQITNNTPPVRGIDAMDTLCLLNKTCTGRLPELKTFYEKIFLHNHLQPEFKNLTFREETVAGWMRYGLLPNVNRAQNSLLHAGNLQALFDNGTLWQTHRDEQALANIRNRFKLDSREHTIVFWEWLRYYLDQFIVQKHRDGSVQHIGIGLYASRFFNKYFIKAQDTIHITLIQHKLFQAFKNAKCLKLFNQTFNQLDPKVLDSLCNDYDLGVKQTAKELGYVCLHKYNVEWQRLQAHGLKPLQMEQFCDPEQTDGFAKLYNDAEKQLNDWYHCDVTPAAYCSDYELAVKQWANSEITLNPIPELGLPPATTLQDWYPDQFRPFEYYQFITKVPERNYHRISTLQGYSLMNWDTFMSLYYMQNVLLDNKPDQQHLVEYIRYLMIYVTFDGFAKPRSPYDLLFGYNDSMITHLKEEIEPVIGGDPSLPNLVHFNDLNVSKEDAVKYPITLHTGKNNLEKLSFYKTINGVNWTNFNASKWTGNETVDYLKNPWDQLDYFVGTDGKQNPPNQFALNNVTIYIPNLLRYGFGTYEGESYERYGITIHKGKITSSLYDSMSESENNKKYYQLFHAAMNLTSLYQFPVFATKNHFHDASRNWTTFVDIWDQNHTFKYQNSSWDDSSIDYQPYSGATFAAVIYLQTNYFYEPDVLFSYNQTSLLPIFSIYRGGNLSQSAANKLFGQLKLALTFRQVCVWAGSIMSAVSLVSIVVCYRSYVNAKAADRGQDQETRDKNLIVSLQPAHRKSESQKSRPQSRRASNPSGESENDIA